jgi:hypothetical protein
VRFVSCFRGRHGCLMSTALQPRTTGGRLPAVTSGSAGPSLCALRAACWDAYCLPGCACPTPAVAACAQTPGRTRSLPHPCGRRVLTRRRKFSMGSSGVPSPGRSARASTRIHRRFRRHVQRRKRHLQLPWDVLGPDQVVNLHRSTAGSVRPPGAHVALLGGGVLDRHQRQGGGAGGVSGPPRRHHLWGIPLG